MNDEYNRVLAEMEQAVPFSELGLDPFNPGHMVSAGDNVGIPSLGKQDALIVEFYNRRKPNKQKTTESGVAFDDFIYVKKYEAGRDNYVVDRPLRESDKMLHPREWHLFQSGKSQIVGTPLETLVNQGFISQGHLSTLHYMGVRTVEKLAVMDEANLQSIGPDGYEVRKVARGYLSHMHSIKNFSDKEKTDARIAALEAQLADAQKPAKKKGRPSKTDLSELAEQSDNHDVEA